MSAHPCSLRGGGAGAFHRHLAEQFASPAGHSGYLLLHGAIPPTPRLSAFYRCQGFDVMEARAPMDMWMVFGVHSSILPGADERFFFRRFQPGSVHRGG